MATQGINIYFAPEELAELHEFIKWKTKKAAAKTDSAMNFTNGDFNADHSLDETTKLIAEARRQLAKVKGERLQLQQHADEQQRLRESLGHLDDRNAARQEKIWDEQMTAQGKAQAENFVKAKRNGGSGRSLIGVDPEIQNQVFTWIEKQRRRFPKRK